MNVESRQAATSGPVSASLAQRLSLSTPWPTGHQAHRWIALTLGLGFVFLILPRSTGWTGSFLHSEDGQVFLTEFLQRGPAGILDTYAGYLHVVPRIIIFGCDVVTSPDGIAPCIAVGSALTRVAIALLAVPVLATYADSWRWGLAAAALSVLFLPAGQQEVLGNVTNLRWFLLFGGFVAVLGVFRGRGLALLAAAIALLASLSEPMTLIFIPVAVWRLLRCEGWARLAPLALLVGSALHLLHIDPSARGDHGGAAQLLDAPSQLIGQLLVRGPLTTQWGLTLAQELTRRIGFPLALVTLVLMAAVLVLGWRGRRPNDPAVPFAVLLIASGFTFLFATLMFPASYISLADFWSPSQPGRYSALTGAFLTAACVLAASRAWRSPRDPRLGSAAVVLAGTVLMLATVGDFGGDARNTDGPSWGTSLSEARAACQPSRESVSVPNSPTYEGWVTTVPCAWLRG